MIEVVEQVKKSGSTETDLIGFIKKFVKINQKKALELKERLKELDLMKVKEEHMIKIIDLMPENSEDLNKIFTDVSLDEDEKRKILETVKQFK